MEKTQINPWRWQDAYGFSQAWKVDGARSLIFVSGQASISAEGTVMHQGDFRAQARLLPLKTCIQPSKRLVPRSRIS